MTNSIAQKFNVFSLLKFAFPTMVMMVFMSLYTIVDGIFVSRLVGSNALSAVNIVYPVINLMFACGIMLSTGGSAIVARQIGEKKESEARENFSFDRIGELSGRSGDFSGRDTVFGTALQCAWSDTSDSFRL